MREKELRLALVCFGGVSLAIYIHGVSKEILKLARASKAIHASPDPNDPSRTTYLYPNKNVTDIPDTELVYFDILKSFLPELDLRVIVDTIAGASAGGMNSVFLGRAIAHDLNFDHLRHHWLIEADVNKQNSTPKKDWDLSAITPQDAPRAVREYLDVLDDAAFGAASEVEPKFTSHSDPASQWTAARKGPAFFAYSTNYLIDTDHAVIVDVEATRSIRQAEVGSVRSMLDRVKDRFDLHPERIIADTAYGSGPMLGWLVDRKIAPHIPVIDKAGRTDGTWSRADFEWDAENNQYICPEGEPLKQFRRNYSDPNRGPSGKGVAKYQALKHTVVDAYVSYEKARSLVYAAAHSFEEQGKGEVATRMAVVGAVRALSFAADRAIQFHGGFGFTYDCDAQLYRRRAIFQDSLFGNTRWHKKKLAALLFA